MTYSFTSNQLKVLLSGCGYNKVVGINLDSSPLENNNTVLILRDLVNNDIISTVDDEFVVKKEVKEIIDVLGSADDYYVVHTANLDVPDLCLFKGEKILLSTLRAEGTDHFSFTFSDINELILNMEDEGYFIKRESASVLEENKLQEYEENIFRSLDPKKPVDISSSVLFSIEHLNSKGESLGFIRIIDYYFYAYIITRIDGKINRFEYSSDKIHEYMERFI